MSEELKPCPFCGGEAALCRPPFGKPYVCCNANFCSGPKDTEDEAIAAWNRRADIHDTALAAAKAEGIRDGMLKAAGLFEPDFEMTVIGMDADDMARVVHIIRAAAGEP